MSGERGGGGGGGARWLGWRGGGGGGGEGEKRNEIFLMEGKKKSRRSKKADRRTKQVQEGFIFINWGESSCLEYSKFNGLRFKTVQITVGGHITKGDSKKPA